jgi:hypothetical protein
MWSHHHDSGMQILLQDTETKKLRTIMLPHLVFPEIAVEDEIDAIFQKQISDAVEENATRVERSIEVAKLALSDCNEPIATSRLQRADCNEPIATSRLN